ncbi:16S rRNA (guanine(527)-N(7))-methyltransferase RsmG [Spiroplasma turonicum]|uniref:Ribosomal RNA small subunit methyltransferase G n=1 Tax=Spiroplasma turonicum TaxID=216946 RepID=A0A0K1P8T3_9MOLU|nr:16S rRNA (guanine(527)-N(7))-methyltransferase RsmG [Spiroplasma turonicum]AKU80307.1 16S rRNA methyltransferase GidB [Spiroplasma turonicum]ALX71308.1 16S rRNA (guanine527-N7)-methyltransferase [Spiroplasma turonicum]
MFNILTQINKNFECDIAFEKLKKYKDLLKTWNSKFNLTAITDDEEIIKKHFYDSLIFSSYIDLINQSILDIGSGAGFPGIVIKIFFPNTNLVLLESNNKKVLFLKEVIKELDLKNIIVINERAEEYTKNNIECFDIVISRAVAQLNILLELGVQALKIDGYFIALKGKNYDLEIKQLNKKEKELGLLFDKKQIVEDNHLGLRANLFYKKFKKTSSLYPRSYNKIKNKPIGD